MGLPFVYLKKIICRDVVINIITVMQDARCASVASIRYYL